MRRLSQALLGLMVIGGAFLASSVWGPTAEAATTTWDCQAFTEPALGSDDSVQWVAVTNLSSDDREVNVRIRDLDGDVIGSSMLDLNPQEGETSTFTLGTAYRASVSAGTDKVKVTAWVFHYDGSDLVAARELSCTKR